MPNDQRDGRARTVGAVTVTVVRMPFDPARAGLVQGGATALDTAGGAACGFTVEGVVRVDGAGVVTVVGVSSVVGRAEATVAAAAAALVAVPGAIELRVTGVAGRTLQWVGELMSYVTG